MQRKVDSLLNKNRQRAYYYFSYITLYIYNLLSSHMISLITKEISLQVQIHTIPKTSFKPSSFKIVDNYLHQ